MSMEISSNYKDYKNEYLDRVQTGQDKVKEASQDQRGEDKNEGIPVPKDEYISNEKSGSKPSGLYRLGQDENGNPKVMYDDPKRVAKAKDVVRDNTIVKKIWSRLKCIRYIRNVHQLVVFIRITC